MPPVLLIMAGGDVGEWRVGSGRSGGREPDQPRPGLPTGRIGRPARVRGPARPGSAGAPSGTVVAMTTASPASATPIFDEVDRWWRDGGDEPTPGTILSFPGARTLRSGSPSEPYHRHLPPA
jgi:hypothetical protein